MNDDVLGVSPLLDEIDSLRDQLHDSKIDLKEANQIIAEMHRFSMQTQKQKDQEFLEYEREMESRLEETAKRSEEVFGEVEVLNMQVVSLTSQLETLKKSYLKSLAIVETCRHVEHEKFYESVEWISLLAWATSQLHEQMGIKREEVL
jgi:hypothetical protein